MAARKVLPKARSRYYIDEPVVVIPLGEYERMVGHLCKMALLDSQPESVKRGIQMRHTLLLQEARQKIKSTKEHYKIKDT